MNTIEISDNTIIGKEFKSQFVLLGDNSVIQSQLLKQAITTKVKHKNIDESIPGVWGTLGMADDKHLNFKGQLTVSKYGNDFSSGEVLKQVEGLYDINDLLDKNTNKVIERFINFDDIEFKDFKLKVSKNKKTGEVTDNIPRLRLTIYLEKGEGALVFYEHSKRMYNQPGEKAIEYIFPDKENMINRDRITYFFPILPRQQIIEKNGNLTFGVEHHKSFVIKILTFQRDNSQKSPSLALKSIIHKANARFYAPSVGTENAKYALLKFNPLANDFFEVDYNTVNVDATLKTLLLLHGTFSTTAGSFGGLKTLQYEENKISWLQKIIKENRYEQILAFDHPTITEDAQQNVNVLLSRLQGVDFSNNPIDIITTSRGGLVGKYLICLTNNSKLPVNKAALIACANGVGYFITGAYIGKFLGVFKAMAGSNPIGSIILGIAQFSVDVFLNMPGCQLMTPKSSRLTTILNAKPKPLNKKIIFQPIVGDWDKLLVEGFLKRIAEQGLDLIIRLMLGSENDWVVGTNNQKILPTGYTTPPIQVKSLHTKYLDTESTIGDVHHYLDDFLT